MANKRAEIAKIYEQLPNVHCKGLCWDQCRPLLATKTERAHMLQIGGEPQSNGYHCAFLSDGKCTVYNARPFICRLYGGDDTFTCPHGCEVEGRRLGVTEANGLLARIIAIDGEFRPVEEDTLDEYYQRMRSIEETQSKLAE